MRHAAWVVPALCAMLAGCAAYQAESLFRAGDYPAAIDAYEEYLVRRAELSIEDAPHVLHLAVAYADPETPRHDPDRAEHYLRLLVDLFPRTAEARQAELMLRAVESRRRVAELEQELASRDAQLQRLNDVLQAVARAESRLRTEVESQGEARADLEGRVAALTRKARILSAEIAQLETELSALKRIDLEGVAEGAVDPP